MNIIGMPRLKYDELKDQVHMGSRFVVFQYCISLLVVTFKRTSSVYYLRATAGTAGKAFKYSLISFFLGWWGIPWGPIWTVSTIVSNFKGGKDVTSEVLESLKC